MFVCGTNSKTIQKLYKTKTNTETCLSDPHRQLTKTLLLITSWPTPSSTPLSSTVFLAWPWWRAMQVCRPPATFSNSHPLNSILIQSQMAVISLCYAFLYSVTYTITADCTLSSAKLHFHYSSPSGRTRIEPRPLEINVYLKEAYLYWFSGSLSHYMRNNSFFLFFSSDHSEQTSRLRTGSWWNDLSDTDGHRRRSSSLKQHRAHHCRAVCE